MSQLNADELDALADELEGLGFQYVVAQVKRDSHRRQAKAIEAMPLDKQTVALLEQLAHHKRERRAQERVMNDALRLAQQLEAKALLTEDEDDANESATPGG